MKLSFLVVIFLIVTAGCGKIQTEAQIRATGNGAVNSNNGPTKVNTLDISTIDFKNFTFPDFSDGKVEKTFTLKAGETESKGAFSRYSLRKTYYFDLTGDERDEAINHILADDCEFGCVPSNLFYIYTTDNNQPKLILKVATGGAAPGALKSAGFKVKEVVLETFGDCSFANGLIKPTTDLKKKAAFKPSNYTRFVFALGENGFLQATRDVLPLTDITNIAEYRPQISFGEQ